MKLRKLSRGAYQVEVAYRTFIVFDNADFDIDGDLILKNKGVLSGAIYDPDSIEQFKLEWSKINEL